MNNRHSMPAAPFPGEVHRLVGRGRILQARAVRGALAALLAVLTGRRDGRPSVNGVPQAS